MKVKDDFHHLIDNIEDEQLLEHYYKLIQKVSNEQNGKLWSSLSESQKAELLTAYDESFNINNQISHNTVSLQHEKWLKP